MSNSFYNILVDEGIKDNPELFCKNVLNAVEKLDLERAMELFQPRRFLEKHLPVCGSDNKMKGIYPSLASKK